MNSHFQYELEKLADLVRESERTTVAFLTTDTRDQIKCARLMKENDNIKLNVNSNKANIAMNYMHELSYEQRLSMLDNFIKAIAAQELSIIKAEEKVEFFKQRQTNEVLKMLSYK